MKRKLTLFTLLGMFAALSAQTYSGTCGDQVNWQLNTRDGVLHITGTGRMYDYTYDTRAPWHPYNNQISMVEIANTVTRIGNWAFNGYHSIDSINFGGVRTIGNNALNNCNGLYSVYIPQLDTLEEYGMNSNVNLRRFVAGNHLKEIQSQSLAWCGNLQLLYLGDGIEYIGSQAVDGCTALDSLYLGQSLKRIDSYAFSNSQNLKRVVFPSTLEDIEHWSFQNSGLLSIHIPANVRNISSEAFHYCGSVLSITVDPTNQTFDSRNNCNAICCSNENLLVRGCQNTIIPNTIITLGSYAFSGCSGLTSITIPNSVTTLHDWVFEACGLTSANFPNSITSCGAAPFNVCYGLSSPLYNNTIFAFLPYNYSGAYTFPSGLNQIVGYACSERDLLTQAYIPAGYTNVGGWVFQYCDLLDTVSVGEGITNLPDGMFYGCINLRGVHLPSTLTYISYHAFGDCRSLLRIDIPDGVTAIGTEAFASCTSLQYVSIPAAIERFESWWDTPTFIGCTSLNHVLWNARTLENPENARRSPFYDIRQQMLIFEFGDSVRYVPNYLCYEMSSLQSIKIGANVSKIGTMTDIETAGNVFYNCSSVRSIEWNARNVESPLMYDYAPFYTFRDKVTSFTIGDSVRVIPDYLCFGMDSLTSLRIPKNVFHIGDYAFRFANGLNTISVDAANRYFDSRQNCNAIIEKETNTLLLGCANTIIPGSVTSIADYAFRNTERLRSLTIPVSVKKIGREAFNGCTNLAGITLPAGITEVEDYTFQNCISLASVALPQGLKQVGIRAFSGCETLPAITMPASVTSIGKEAFDKTYMTGMTMLGTTPPSIDVTSLPDACPIGIPCSAITAYQNTPVWSSLGSRLSAQYPFSITASANNVLWGDVRIQRTSCEDVVLEATAAHGFHFVEWQDARGQHVSTQNPYSLNLTANTVLIAFFQAGAAPQGASARIQVMDRNVHIQTEEPAAWRLIDLQGKPVDFAEGDMVCLTAPAGGMYILQSAGETVKIMIR